MPYMVRGEPAPPRTEPIEPDPSLPRALVIGAGASGITAAKALNEARVPFDWFEMGPEVGGNWVLNNPNGVSACYSTLEMNTSGPRMSFSDFPMPNEDYPMHWEVREYFNAYVDHFALRDLITFNAKVERVERLGDGTWEATVVGDGVEGGRIVRRYDAVVVCNGHHWDKRWPDPPYPGEFSGEVMHGHDYRGPEQLEGRRVLVVGGGNSGMDVARDASYVAEATYLSLRRGVWIIRKRLDGRPVDQIPRPPWLPEWAKQLLLEFGRVRSGDPARVGLPRPDHRIGEAHPTLSDQIYDRLAAGAVIPKPAIEELRGERVRFADGSEEEIDLIVYCTGYKVSFPFFDEGLISAPGNRLDLFRRTFHPDIPGVYFVGFMQPFGAIMPLAEVQGVWIAELLTGRYALPSREEMLEDMRRERERHDQRFYRSERHTMEVDFDEWLAEAERERRRGAERARALGSPLGVPARAARAAQASGGR